ncbi:MAG: DUF6174 domain-containing protein [Gammaproteobacteria bacterium]|nr:DUF6174 domain-containing protein [Gammaproteobacteria bacterium]MDP6694572.1 DUF6174 domain-containing protein [Gammaproteobacteria bacterium]
MSSFIAKYPIKVLQHLLLGSLLVSLVNGPGMADEIDDATVAWDTAGITDYSYTLTQRVTWGATSIALIEVRNGNVVSAGNIIKRTNPVPEGELDEDSVLRKTITDLLNDIRSRDDFIRASYDPDLGHPINVFYQNADFEEAEDQLEIRDFTVLSDAG